MIYIYIIHNVILIIMISISISYSAHHFFYHNIWENWLRLKIGYAQFQWIIAICGYPLFPDTLIFIWTYHWNSLDIMGCNEDISIFKMGRRYFWFIFTTSFETLDPGADMIWIWTYNENMILDNVGNNCGYNRHAIKQIYGYPLVN